MINLLNFDKIKAARFIALLINATNTLMATFIKPLY